MEVYEITKGMNGLKKRSKNKILGHPTNMGVGEKQRGWQRILRSDSYSFLSPSIHLNAKLVRYL